MGVLDFIDRMLATVVQKLQAWHFSGHFKLRLYAASGRFHEYSAIALICVG